MKLTAVSLALVALLFPSALSRGAQPSVSRISIQATVEDIRIHHGTSNEIRLLWNLAVRPSPIGTGYVRCGLMGRGDVYGRGISYCVSEYVLPLGKILVAGVRHNRRMVSYVITGASGVYEGKNGTLTVTSDGEGKLNLTFLLGG